MSDETNVNKEFPVAGSDITPARRQLLKALAGAGGVFAAGKSLPEKWMRPVVDAVLLPAHAQATGLNQTYYGTVQPNAPGPAPAGKLLDFLISPANAGFSKVDGAQAIICIQVNGNSFTAQALLGFYDVSTGFDCQLLNGGGTVGGAAANLGTISGFSNVMLQITAATATNVSFNLSFTVNAVLYVATGTINAGACETLTCPN